MEKILICCAWFNFNCSLIISYNRNKSRDRDGLDSVYLPERTLTVVPEEAAPTAAEIVKNALSIDVPLLVSSPSFAT